MEGKRDWFPFRIHEVEFAIGVFGFGATLAAYLGVESSILAVSAFIFLGLVYFAGLLVNARSTRGSFRFVQDGALGGRGYVEVLRSARRSLLLTHVDDDAPNDELLGLYRSLLDRGVKLRRVILRRADATPESLRWIAAFGNHENLSQRIVPPRDTRLATLSFVVVDGEETVISVPAFEEGETGHYASAFVLRHLLILEDVAVAKAFGQVHAALWERARPLPDARNLGYGNQMDAAKRNHAS